MKAEQKLNLYATIGSTARNMIALLDNSYRYLEANQAYLDACGLTLEQLLERTMPEVFGEEFFAHTIQPHTDRCLAGKEISREAWYELPTHGSRFMAVTYTPYLVPDTGVNELSECGVVGTGVEATGNLCLPEEVILL